MIKDKLEIDKTKEKLQILIKQFEYSITKICQKNIKEIMRMKLNIFCKDEASKEMDEIKIETTKKLDDICTQFMICETNQIL